MKRGQEPQVGQKGKELSTGEEQNMPNTMQFISGCLIPSSFKTEKEKERKNLFVV